MEVRQTEEMEKLQQMVLALVSACCNMSTFIASMVSNSYGYMTPGM